LKIDRREIGIRIVYIVSDCDITAKFNILRSIDNHEKSVF